MSKDEDVRSARELTVGQQLKLVTRYQNWVFVVVSADHHPGNPFSATNIRVKRLVRKRLFGIIPFGWEGVGSGILLEPDEEIILV